MYLVSLKSPRKSYYFLKQDIFFLNNKYRLTLISFRYYCRFYTKNLYNYFYTECLRRL